jgi:hypothetical protein
LPSNTRKATQWVALASLAMYARGSSVHTSLRGP